MPNFGNFLLLVASWPFVSTFANESNGLDNNNNLEDRTSLRQLLPESENVCPRFVKFGGAYFRTPSSRAPLPFVFKLNFPPSSQASAPHNPYPDSTPDALALEIYLRDGRAPLDAEHFRYCPWPPPRRASRHRSRSGAQRRFYTMISGPFNDPGGYQIAYMKVSPESVRN